ncbi:two-component sensor histidine kinase [Nostoc sp. NIES-3756]|uniref:PAS domain S-box protein n=1 Tax=Nostoc sp. NIES-3756 TaxID=1751286 RepID=UPI00071FD614|nr:PAS domain S-box protein [Nostoc sp. NIES-3756]BAT56031.1 two-component sensor histidine kinase [Nostoc sp. NIES-3756]
MKITKISHLTYKKLEDKYSYLLSSSLDLFCTVDFDGKFKYLNPAWTKTLGWSSHELLNKPFIDCLHPEDCQDTLLEFQKLFQVNTVCFENRYLCSDGSYKWLSWKAMFLNTKKVIHALVHDITSYKENEIKLQKDIQELEAFKFALNTHSLVAITDLKGRITYANDLFCQVSKYSKNELLGQDHRIINSGYHSKEFFANLWKTISQGQIWKGEVKNRAKDGSFYWVDTLITPLLGDDGKPYQYVSIRTDITQRKLSELALLERSRLSVLSAEVSLALSQSGTLSEIMQNCIHNISQSLNIALVCIWTCERQNEQLQLQAGIQCQDTQCHTLKNPQDFPENAVLANNIMGSMTQNYQPMFNEIVRLQNNQYSNLYLSAYPLIIEEKLIGIMALFSQNLFTEATHNLLNWIASNIAIAIDRIWAREELLSRREALLLRLASQIRSSLDLDTILEIAVTEIRSLLQIDRCYFLRYLPNVAQAHLIITHEAVGSNLTTMLGDVPLKNNHWLLEALLNQELVCIDNIQNNFLTTQDTPEIFSQFGITSQLLLPIKSQSEEFGAIVCSHCHGERVWSQSDIVLLQAVSDQLAIAIDHAQLYIQSRETALAAQAQAEKLTQTLYQLQQAQSQLVQHEKMSSLGQLVAGVAHEINNPVNFIHGNISHAKEYIQDILQLLNLYQEHYPHADQEIQDFTEEIDIDFIIDDLQKILTSMNMGTNRIREIVLSLRNFSRLDEAEKKLVDIHEGIENTLLILHHRWKNSGIGLGISIIKEYSEIPLIDCYPGQLNQVFMNIITNAIDALEESVVHGKIAHNPQIHIHTELLDSKFASIRIADNGVGMTEEIRNRLFDPFFTTKPVGKGTGLGLSISYQIIVEKHGGTLRCLSEPGKGTEFWIQIPVK